MKRRVAFAVAVVAAVAVALAACGDERETSNPPGEGPGVTGASSGAESGGTGGGGSGGGSGLGGAGGADPACEACWSASCEPEVDACLAEEACACRIACDEDLACVDACPASAPFEALLRCIAEASFGSCAETCGTECERCAFSGCPDEVEACLDDARCVCQLWCDEDPACTSTCGESPASQPLRDCVGQQASCSGVCEP